MADHIWHVQRIEEMLNCFGPADRSKRALLVKILDFPDSIVSDIVGEILAQLLDNILFTYTKLEWLSVSPLKTYSSTWSCKTNLKKYALIGQNLKRRHCEIHWMQSLASSGLHQERENKDQSCSQEPLWNCSSIFLEQYFTYPLHV